MNRIWYRAMGAAALAVVAVAPVASAKNKNTGSFSVGCLTQDTTLQSAEGLATGDPAAVVTISPANLWPPHHKLIDESIVMTLSPDATLSLASPVDVSLTISDIVNSQQAEDDAGHNGCGKPTGKQGQDFEPADIETSNIVQDGTLQAASDSVDVSGVALRAERCSKVGPRTYTVTVQCCDTTNGVCDTVGTLNGVALDALPELQVTVPKNRGKGKH